MLIGVVGLNGSGKDTVAKYLVQHYNFEHKDLGQEIRDELKKRGKNYLDRNEMIDLANEMRKKLGANYWCKRAIEALHSKNMVITSIRNPKEVDEIVSRGGKIVEIFAEQNARIERTVKRVNEKPGFHGDTKSPEHFKELEKKELTNTDPTKQQLIKTISMADYKLNNNGSLQDLYKEIEKLLKELKFNET
jgi:dephospho-CoA kinase